MKVFSFRYFLLLKYELYESIFRWNSGWISLYIGLKYKLTNSIHQTPNDLFTTGRLYTPSGMFAYKLRAVYTEKILSNA